jgi:hypothetical protein
LRGRVREGGSFARRGYDHFQNAIPIFQNIGIPEAKHPVSFGCEPPISLNVLYGIGVLPAVEFHNQPVVVANKIDNEASNGRLTSEAQTV